MNAFVQKLYFLGRKICFRTVHVWHSFWWHWCVTLCSIQTVHKMTILGLITAIKTTTFFSTWIYSDPSYKTWQPTLSAILNLPIFTYKDWLLVDVLFKYNITYSCHPLTWWNISFQTVSVWFTALPCWRDNALWPVASGQCASTVGLSGCIGSRPPLRIDWVWCGWTWCLEGLAGSGPFKKQKKSDNADVAFFFYYYYLNLLLMLRRCVYINIYTYNIYIFTHIQYIYMYSSSTAYSFSGIIQEHFQGRMGRWSQSRLSSCHVRYKGPLNLLRAPLSGFGIKTQSDLFRNTPNHSNEWHKFPRYPASPVNLGL